MDIKFTKLESEDIPELITPMTKAFNEDAKQFQGKEKDGPPGYDDGSFLKTWGIDNIDSHAVSVRVDGKLAGAFIVWWNEGGESTLGNIFVDPAYQNLGVGTSIWEYIESHFPTQKWRLETPVWSDRNHYFYENKCGFRQVRVNGDQILLEKDYS